MSTQSDEFPTDLIKAQLGTRVPLIMWYISPRLVDKLPLDTIEALTHEPKLILEAGWRTTDPCLRQSSRH